MAIDLLEKMRAKRAQLTGSPSTASQEIPANAGTTLSPESPASLCPVCQSCEFWQNAYNHLACLRCHPPKSQTMVRRLLLAMPDGSWRPPIPSVDGLGDWFESLPVPPDPAAKPAAPGTVPCRWCGGRRFHRHACSSKHGPIVTCLTCYPSHQPLPASEVYELSGAELPPKPDALGLWIEALQPAAVPAGLRLSRWSTVVDPTQFVRWLKAGARGGASNRQVRETALALKAALTARKT